jgi:FAD/FMN-containing dehydrogenase
MSSASHLARPIDPTAVAALRRTVRGRVAYPADTAYAVAGDVSPAAVVLAVDEADVAAAVRVARLHGLGVGRADGALMVDVARLAGVAVHLAERTATVGVGATWRDVMAAAAPYGLAPVPSWRLDGPVGPDVLGGAVGPFVRRLGLCAEHVRSLRVVLADGVVRTADDDLRHGLLGGPSLGIVTQVDLALSGPAPGSAEWRTATRTRITRDGRVEEVGWGDEAAHRPAVWERGFLLGAGAAPERDEVLTTIAAEYGEVLVDELGGATDRPSENAADASGAHYLVTVRADAEPRDGSPARSLEPWLTGGSLLAHHPVEPSWPPATVERLAALRRRHDPHGLFR